MADGKASKSKSLFRMECAVSVSIKASPETIWRLLTDSREFARWNSSVVSLDGRIALGETIQLKVDYAPSRTFKLRVSEFVPNARMVWRDGSAPMFQGVRTYTLTPRGDGSTEFSMVEVLSGLLLPMIGGSLPDFAPPFERYAADLKKAAEGR
ncbi:MAG: SRPBCC domain-containing protein [Anaerolineae bacterium]|nr:SRPBCC domain-containing protein [Anaerolineae bacterium]